MPIQRRRARKLGILGLAMIITAMLITACSSSGGNAAREASKLSVPTLYDGLKGAKLSYLASGSTSAKVDAMNATILKSFKAATGASVTVDTECCGITKLQALSKSGNEPWTVTVFATTSDFTLAKQAGLLMPLNTKLVPLNKLEPGTYNKYGFEMNAYSANLTWNTKDFPAGEAPTSMADLFNTKQFPGKRCFYQGVQWGGTLEAPLLASGVSPAHLYPLNVRKALSKLDTIRKDIIFYSSGAQGIQALSDGQCSMGLMWNGTVFQAKLNDPSTPLAISFKDAIWTTGMFAIPAKTQNVKGAYALARHIILDQDGLQSLLNQTAYEVIPLKQGLQVSKAVAPYVLAGQNKAEAIQEDDNWYGKNINTLTNEFTQWLTTGK